MKSDQTLKIESIKSGDRAVPEYEFEAGAKEVVSRIMRILKAKDRAVVAFSCTSTNVGKSTLAKTIIQNLYTKGVEAMVYHGLEEVDLNSRLPDRNMQVFIFDQLDWFSVSSDKYAKWKNIRDGHVREFLKKIGIVSDGVDLWVGIYRPDRQFLNGEKYKPLADLIIRNEQAKDKITKIVP